MKINPFKPNSPVSPGMFAGRIIEIKAMEKGLFQTKHGQPVNFLVTGERGIGKSSLINVIDPTATGDIKISGDSVLNFLTVNVQISKNTTLASLIKLIEQNLYRKIGQIEKIKAFLEEIWEFASRIKIMDSGISSSQPISDLDLLLDNFTYSLSKTCLRVTNPGKGETQRDGIVFFIDEADNACEDLHIGYFFKAVTEQLQRCGCNNVMFVVAGLPEVIEKLKNSHESSLRVFSHLKVRELTPDERRYVIDRGIEVGNEKNQEEITITGEAKNYISTLSEGYPHFIQQFAYSAFEFNDDGEISAEDASHGAFSPGGALDEIGTRYYHSAYNEQIKTDEYREVLSIIAENMNQWIKKKDIRDKFSGADHTVTHALKALTDRKIILKNPSTVGEYRLQQRGFALWIKLFGERKK
ncbi:MAG: hypothetical protein ACR2OJ_04920 [Hyphomicrobiales bacterium]